MKKKNPFIVEKVCAKKQFYKHYRQPDIPLAPTENQEGPEWSKYPHGTAALGAILNVPFASMDSISTQPYPRMIEMIIGIGKVVELVVLICGVGNKALHKTKSIAREGGRRVCVFFHYGVYQFIAQFTPSHYRTAPLLLL